MEGTNTKVELLALWCLAKFASILRIDTMNVYGDSMVIVNWAKKLGSLPVLLLELYTSMMVILDLQTICIISQ